MSEPNIIWHGMNCEQIYRMLEDHDTKTAFDNQFIDRLFEKSREDFLVYQIHEVGFDMTRESKNYFVKKLNGKKYHFVKVRFDGNKLYSYVTKDPSIRVGDSVTIPTGNDFAPGQKLKTVEDVYEGSLDELDFDIEYLRCVEGKLRNISCPNCCASIEVDVSQKTGKCSYCHSLFYLV